MKSNFLEILTKVSDSLSVNKKLIISNELISLSDDKLRTPIGDILSLLLQHKSNLKDQFVDFESLHKFIAKLTNLNVVTRINHIGFCYKVPSQEQEKKRLINLVAGSGVHLYIEPSNDEEMWFFVGNADDWEDPMIELIPIEKTADKWADYWLPHVQIDIDTLLTDEEIIRYIKMSFGNTVVPFPIKIDDIVYIVRNRLGTIDGINITLDLATKSRNVQYQRQSLLKKIA